MPSNLKCSDCLYFQSNKKPGHPCCCKDQGVKAFATAKVCFFPDVTKVVSNIDAFAIFSQFFLAFTPKQRKIAMALINQANKSKAKHFPFGTKVYIANNGGEYLSDYMAGYVLGYQGEYALVAGSPNRKSIGRAYIAHLLADSCIGLAEFEKIKAEKKKQGLINNPKTKERRITSIEAYEPPTIDQAPRETGKKKKKLDTYDKITGLRVLRY